MKVVVSMMLFGPEGFRRDCDMSSSVQADIHAERCLSRQDVCPQVLVPKPKGP